MAKYEVAQGGDLHLIIEAKDDDEFFDKANSWETIIKEKLAEIGIEFSWDWHCNDDFNPEGLIYDYPNEEWIDWKTAYEREYGKKR